MNETTVSYDCGACDRPNSAEAKMVECESCETWFHLSCAGVSPGVEKRSWICANCTPLMPVASAATKLKTKEAALQVGAKKGSRKLSVKSDAGITVSGGKQLEVPEQTAGKPTTGAIPKATKVSEQSDRVSDAGITVTGCQKLEVPERTAGKTTTGTIPKATKASDRVKNGKATEDLLKPAEQASTPKKHPEIQKAASSRALSAKANTTSSRARAMLSLQRLEEKRSLEQRKLKEEQNRLKKERELLEKEKALEEKELTIKAKALKAEEQYLEEKYGLEEQLVEDDQHSQISYQSGRSKVQVWIDQQEQDSDGGETPLNPQEEEQHPQDGRSHLSDGDVNPNRQADPFRGQVGNGRGTNVLRNYQEQIDRVINPTASQLTASVPSIMETLRRLYGRPELLVKNLLGKVRRLEAPKPERLDTLINFGMAVQQLCDHLEAANLRSHLANPTLLEELVEKLPASIKLDWVRWKRAYEEPSLKEFGEFMDNLVVDASEVTVLVAPRKDTLQSEKGKLPKKGLVYAHGDTGYNSKVFVIRKPCPICGKVDHRVRNCDGFKQMALESRLKAVEQYKLCGVCLYDHGNQRCKSRFHCNVGDCRQRHHSLLHPIQSSPATRAQVQAHTSVSRPVLFRIVPITLYYGDRSFDTYGFLDEGSSFTLVEVSVAHKLGVVGVPEPLELAWTSNVVRKEKSSQRIDLMISGRGETERFKLSSAHTVNALSLPKQSLPFHEMAERLTHLHDLPILSYVDAEPKVLIGLQNLELFVPLENRIGQPGEPIAVRSVLGWTLYGPCEMNSETNRFVGHVRRYDGDRELNEIIRQRFVLEDIGACAMLPESAEVKRARALLEQTTSRKDCRFVTGLLWKKDDVRLPNSLPMALRRMKSLEAKLARDPDLRDNVHQQIREYIEKDYAHMAIEEELSASDPNRIWYLPLNVVSHPKKPGKKRLVWDAAAQFSCYT
ncbi:uncharacterized protein LOC134221640 [Armigeres subalbatus]|uniref:uncharacterized protein LOC134221640 n=1 Tax=Armigeres subalbatus TaxID=124917 RepID=UPI002ED230AE